MRPNLNKCTLFVQSVRTFLIIIKYIIALTGFVGILALFIINEEDLTFLGRVRLLDYLIPGAAKQF